MGFLPGMPQLRFVDINPAVVDSLRTAFAAFPEVEVSLGDILDVARVSIVSPANSQGFMDGGIDRVYTEFFGLGPQTELQSAIARREDGLLPVAQVSWSGRGMTGSLI